MDAPPQYSEDSKPASGQQTNPFLGAQGTGTSQQTNPFLRAQGTGASQQPQMPSSSSQAPKRPTSSSASSTSSQRRNRSNAPLSLFPPPQPSSPRQSSPPTSAPTTPLAPPPASHQPRVNEARQHHEIPDVPDAPPASSADEAPPSYSAAIAGSSTQGGFRGSKPVIPLGQLREHPDSVDCPYCGHRGATRTTSHSSSYTWYVHTLHFDLYTFGYEEFLFPTATYFLLFLVTFFFSFLIVR